MSDKLEATFHGADIITRLRAYGPHSDYEDLMREAADELERLREDAQASAYVALIGAAVEARTRGDIGKPGCVEVWDWLEHWAGRKYK